MLVNNENASIFQVLLLIPSNKTNLAENTLA